MTNLLVLGATGFVGRSVCEKLVERSGGAGGRIRVATRRLPRARHLQLLPTVELAEADVHDDAQLARLLRDTDVVINLVAILHGSAAEFERVHVRLPERLAAACRKAGVRRVVHVSSLGASVDAPSHYLRSKARGEAALRTSGLDLTVLRPSVIFGERDRFINLFASLQSIFPVMPLGGAHARFQPVWVDDVAAAIVRCLDDPSTVGLAIECCGPRVYSLRELVEAAGRWSGSPRPVVALPLALAKLQALVLELIPGKTLMSRDIEFDVREADEVAVALGDDEACARSRQRRRHGGRRQHVQDLACERRPDARCGVGIEIDLRAEHRDAERVVRVGVATGHVRCDVAHHCLKTTQTSVASRTANSRAPHGLGTTRFAFGCSSSGRFAAISSCSASMVSVSIASSGRSFAAKTASSTSCAFAPSRSTTASVSSRYLSVNPRPPTNRSRPTSRSA